jgi:hypothetical protein
MTLLFGYTTVGENFNYISIFSNNQVCFWRETLRNKLQVILQVDVTQVMLHATGQLPGQDQSQCHWTPTCPWCETWSGKPEPGTVDNLEKVMIGEIIDYLCG